MPSSIDDFLRIFRDLPSLIGDVRRGEARPETLIGAAVAAIVALFAVIQAVKFFLKILKYLVVIAIAGGVIYLLRGGGRPERPFSDVQE